MGGNEEADADDCWDAFGSEDDDSDDIGRDNSMEEENQAAEESANPETKSFVKAASKVSLHLVKTFLFANSQIAISQRKIGLLTCLNRSTCDDNEKKIKIWKDFLTEREFSQVSQLEDAANLNHPMHMLHDAVIVIRDDATQSASRCQEKAYNHLVKGGVLLIVNVHKGTDVAPRDIVDSIDSFMWIADGHEVVFTDDCIQVLSLRKRLCCIQERSCLWLPSKHSLQRERQHAHEATVPVSAHESQTGLLTPNSIDRAVQRMQEYGYCILPSLLDPQECEQWGQTVLADLHEASQLLLEREAVDIFHPHSSQKDPQSYRELSMREDLRMDLRDGPRLRRLRGGRQDNDGPVVLRANDNGNSSDCSSNRFFRLHPSILEVVRQTMNPRKGTLYKGNFGRHNFEGSGPDGSYQDMRLSSIGGIVSLPGSADQALHADTPHLFEHQTLPAHYINAFTLGCSGRDTQVGCTAFIHGSHNIEFTAQYLNDEAASTSSIGERAVGDHNQVYDFLVRPQLELGDVLLFDCRTLHFGLGNQSSNVERPLLYCNMTHAWFHDPKNWDSHHPIFHHHGDGSDN
jgi:Phytanoyl-CoA dioxygenase (PhyH)